MKPEEIKLAVEKNYRRIAEQDTPVKKTSACCCRESDKAPDFTIFSVDYSSVEGYRPEANLNLGCGIPTEYAGIRQGDHVLDLGSGAGNDCFVARSLVGPEGRVTGLDFTDAMIDKAMKNLAKTGFNNVEFIRGDIEEMPLPANAFDVVVSNCVLNLVPDKHKAFSEIFRVLKPGGHFCVSDVVVEGELPDSFREAADLYASCISGALKKEHYLEIIENTGFTGITIHSSVNKLIPDDIREAYLELKENSANRSEDPGEDPGENPGENYRLLSITVSATRPAT